MWRHLVLTDRNAELLLSDQGELDDRERVEVQLRERGVQSHLFGLDTEVRGENLPQTLQSRHDALPTSLRCPATATRWRPRSTRRRTRRAAPAARPAAHRSRTPTPWRVARTRPRCCRPGRCS